MPIICATDLSERSRPALVAGAALARRLGDDLWLVHVVDGSAAALEGLGRQALEAAALARLGEEAAALAAGAVARKMVLVGPTASSLARLAAENQARLLVVASQGQGASPLYRLGGTSERVAHDAEVPVLVVRDAAPFESWARGERALRVLLGADWSASCEPPIRWVRELRQAGACDVIVGHVHWPEIDASASRRYGLAPAAVAADAHAEAQRLVVRDLGKRIGDLGGSGDVSIRLAVGLGRVGDHLLSIAEAEQADLVVVGTHRRASLARLASVAGVALHFSHSSVAVVPSPRGEVMARDEVPRLRTVLVPSDLSAEATHAIPYAYALLGAQGGEVVLLHVAAGGEARPDAELIAALRKAVPTRGLPAEIPTRVEIVREQSPARAILAAAERLGADAICLGCRQRSGLTRTLLGSVADAILRESRVPLFVVHPPPP